MPFLLLLLIAVLAGLGAAFLTRRYPGGEAAPAVVEVAREAGEHATGAAGRRAARAARLDPEKATGLALTLALVVVIAGGVVLALLAVVVRSTDVLASLDSSVAEWGDNHASAWSHDALTLVTQLGETWMVVLVAIVVAGVEIARTRSRWVVPFLIAVILGDKLLTEAIKQLVDRARPTLESVAATLGPSFPSGHTSTAAAAWAAFALVAGRWWGRPSLAGARRHRRRHRGRGRGQPRPPRRALADRRARRPRPRLGLVRDLRDRLRRPPPQLRRRRSGRGPRRGGSL